VIKLAGLTFDYIVIGTGPAGSVIAKILTNDKRTSVLLVEAGNNNDNDKPIQDSTFAPELEENFFPEYFWQGEGLPEPGLGGRTFEWTTGRLSGGGSSINGEQYVRPTASVLRQWEKLLGPIWSPRRATLRFKRLEKYNGRTSNRKARGFRGRIDIRQTPKVPTNMSRKLVSAIEQATGFAEILDYNNPRTPVGPFTRWQLYQKPNGRRESASTAFLSSDVVDQNGRGVNGRKLSVLYKTTASRILFRGTSAFGVELLKEGKCIRALARKKVILSAGINSAQLLMLSGIGPAKVLQKAHIPVVFNNSNVGKQLRNHTLNTAVFTANQSDHPVPSNDPNAIYSGGAFLPAPIPGSNPKHRAVQLIGIGSPGTLTIAILYLRPKGRGFIRVQNNDPLKTVLANEGFLASRHDLEAVKNIFKIYIKDIAARLASIDSSYQLISPTPDIIDDDTKLEEFIKQNFAHQHHEQGSLRMAPLRQGGVVNRFGRVHGVKNLIVADASLVPFTVDGNVSATAFLIGETIARHLLK
jgi:choline dehydrogenase